MPLVPTVRGPIDSRRIGRTLMHEHIFVLTPEVNSDYPDLSWGDEEGAIAEGITKLRAAKDRGIDTLVDLTVLGCGRSIDHVQRVNEAVDINIVVATGLFTFDELPRFFANRAQPAGGARSRDVLTDIFVRDITEGIGASGVRAGVLKCCTDAPGVTANVERVLRATARAHRETGVPISTHTDVRNRGGLAQQRIFAEEGVDLARVVIGHSGDSTDLDYLRELMDRGSTIGCDRFGLYREGMPTLEERVDVVARLCELGYGDRIVLSHDANCHSDWHRKSFLDTLTEWKFTHLTDKVLPALRERGVSERALDQMLVGNPRRILEPGSPY